MAGRIKLGPNPGLSGTGAYAINHLLKPASVVPQRSLFLDVDNIFPIEFARFFCKRRHGRILHITKASSPESARSQCRRKYLVRVPKSQTVPGHAPF